MINDPTTGQILKWGVTNDPIGRYNSRDYAEWDSEYEGNFQMNILKNFDTRNEALTAERYLTERVGGPENDEDWANSVPSSSSWESVLHEAISDLQSGDVG